MFVIILLAVTANLLLVRWRERRGGIGSPLERARQEAARGGER
jgi:hypothetical protein